MAIRSYGLLLYGKQSTTIAMADFKHIICTVIWSPKILPLPVSQKSAHGLGGGGSGSSQDFQKGGFVGLAAAGSWYRRGVSPSHMKHKG